MSDLPDHIKKKRDRLAQAYYKSTYDYPNFPEGRSTSGFLPKFDYTQGFNAALELAQKENEPVLKLKAWHLAELQDSHMLISTNGNYEFQKEWELARLPPRVAKVINENESLRRENEVLRDGFRNVTHKTANCFGKCKEFAREALTRADKIREGK